MKSHIAFLGIFLFVSINGCSTRGGNWGASTTFTPGWDTFNTSVINAAKDPHTWVPLIIAAAFSIDDFDQQTVDWATRHNPLFGNIEDAQDASDLFQDLSKVNYLVTALTVPSGEGKEGLLNKARGLGFGILAIGINDGITKSIKSATDRERPDNEKENSFPSLHASSAAISARLASRNIDHMPLTDTQKKIWQWSSYTVAGLTGWARVEGKRHYPSDVLAGYALGNFLGAFLNDAFITPDYREKLNISVYAEKENGWHFNVNYRW